MTTPEPVSPAPDTEGLREQVARALYRADGLNGNASHDPWEERSQKVHLRYLALAEDGVLPLVTEREAGLRSDLDQARRELNNWRSGRLRKSWPGIESVPDGLFYAAELVRTQDDIADDAHAALHRHASVRLKTLNDLAGPLLAERNRLRAELARVSGARIPDNAAFLRWCEWPDCLRSFDARTGPRAEVDGAGWIYVRTGMHVLLCPDHANAGHRPQRFEWQPGDTTIRTSCECGERSGELTPTNHATCMEWWRAHVLGATPTTGPAPAAAVGEVRALLVHPVVWDRVTNWLTSRGLTVDPAGDLEGIPTYSMGISDELAAAAPQDPAQPTGKWNEGDVAYDSTGFVHVRYAQGWRTYPRTAGTQYGDDAMEAHLGPLVRLDAVPPGTSDTGALPPGFVREDATDDLIPDLPKCTVAGCTHIRWREFDVCQFHVPLKGNVEVRRPPAPAVDGDTQTTPTPEEP